MALTWQDLKQAMPQEAYEDITGGDDALGDRFLSSARAWLSARLAPCGIATWDEDNDEVIRHILINQALYELYSYVEREEIASDKRNLANEMLRGRFGRCVDASLSAEDAGAERKGLPVGSVKQGAAKWNGFE